MKLHIILPVHNRIETTKSFIECLKKQTYQNYHLILIDDGSTDGTSEYVKKEMGNCTIIKGKGNWWWAGSLQKGYKWLKNNARIDDIVLIINDDVTISEDYLNIGLGLIAIHERSLIYTLCYSMQTSELFWSGVHIEWKNYSFVPNVKKEYVNCCSTRGLFLRIKDFLIIGGFHPILLPHYASDYEFTYRAFKKGYSFHSDPKLNLLMDESSSGFRSFESDTFPIFLSKYFSRRNPNNPIYQTMFVALSCPWKFKLKNWFKVIRTGISIVVKKLVHVK